MKRHFFRRHEGRGSYDLFSSYTHFLPGFGGIATLLVLFLVGALLGNLVTLGLGAVLGEQFIGNYGMQYSVYRSGALEVVRDIVLPCDKESVAQRAAVLREKFGFTEYTGDHVEFHPSGCVTIPLLGTKADIADKLAFDPDRKKRRAMYDEVKEIFSDYAVYIGGSSSFDFIDRKYNKYEATMRYANEHGIKKEEIR